MIGFASAPSARESAGQYLLSNVAQLENNELVAVCDVYEPHRMAAKSRFGPAARDYSDHRALLDRKDVDAVIIATPDHWHVPITIDAVRAAKDVYCEKPVTHTPAEGDPLIAAVRESKRVVQTGTQQRSWEHFMHAKELVANGTLGQVTLIHTYWYQNHIANQTAGPAIDLSKLDWKRFLGTAADRPFDADQYAHWRWYWDFGGGAMTDLFVHWVDVAHWYMGDDMPTRATATGVKALLQQRQTPDTMSAALSYRQGAGGVRQRAAGLPGRRRADDPRNQGGDAAAPQRVRSVRGSAALHGGVHHAAADSEGNLAAGRRAGPHEELHRVRALAQHADGAGGSGSSRGAGRPRRQPGHARQRRVDAGSGGITAGFMRDPETIETELMEISAIAEDQLKLERIIAWCAAHRDEIPFALHQLMSWRGKQGAEGPKET